MKIKLHEYEEWLKKKQSQYNDPIKWKPCKALMIESVHQPWMGFGEEKFYSPYHDEFVSVSYVYSRSDRRLLYKSKPHRYITLYTWVKDGEIEL
jgi:hypothetical protein